MDDFEIMQELDKLSELKEHVDPRYAPLVEAKINYRLQQLYKSKEKEHNSEPIRKIFLSERSGGR